MKKLILALSVSLVISGCNDTGTENHSPILVGSPQTTTVVNTLYEFKPLATDADGDLLLFSVENKPQWAQFDASNGYLTGTPDDIGQYADIRISVTDGELTTSLQFSLSVIAGDADVPPEDTPPEDPRYQATLHWQAPTEDTNGQALSGALTYKVLYGTQIANPDTVVDVVETTPNYFTVDNLPSGQYYFYMTATDAQGHESARSDAFSVLVE